MTTVYVQFSDATDSTIVSVFANAQDPATFPNQGTIDSSDARYKSFYDAAPVSAQVLLPSLE